MTAPAPVARRDEGDVVYCGAAPENWDPKLPRQSETSTEVLIDPPAALPNPYGWMRDDKREKPEILQHLKAENAYTEQLTKHLDGLRKDLYKEMLSSIQETDYTLPRPDGDWYYYSRTFEGKSYTVHCRAPRTAGEDAAKVEWDIGSKENPILEGEQVLLDVNLLGEGKSYCSMGTVKHSPSHKLLAYAADFKGDEICSLYIKDLATGEEKTIGDDLKIYGSVRWGADDDTIFYMKLDDTKRPFQLFRRKLSSDKEELLFEENDELYWMGMHKSFDGKYLFLSVESKETSEVHYFDLHDDTAQRQCIAERRKKVLYEVEHRKGRWWILSNVGGLPNMGLFSSPALPNSQDSWKLVLDNKGHPVFPGGNDRSLDDVTCFEKQIVAEGREGGLPRVWMLGVPKDDTDTEGQVTVTKSERLTFAEDAYDVGLSSHYEHQTSKFVVAYDSMVTPTQYIEIALHDSSQRNVVKERNVPGYDKALFGCERTTALARDGKTEIPVSLVYRKDVMKQHDSSGKPVHVHLYGYGSYGSCMEATFRATRLALLSRGMVFAVAHVRGGGEMGRTWYEEPNGAKYLCKKNTFTDFVDVARWLVETRKMTSPDLLSCEGRSAGGLLIGTSVNLAPDLFRAAILGVPFVDLMCTMSDASIPLTVVEWEEWGNPNEEKFHQYMRDYSPMDNVQANVKYPSCLLTGGLHDPRVAYWEPAKLAATLRHSQSSDSGPVLLKIDMSAGHFSASDRYKYLKELAFDYAFLLDQVGLASK